MLTSFRATRAHVARRADAHPVVGATRGPVETLTLLTTTKAVETFRARLFARVPTSAGLAQTTATDVIALAARAAALALLLAAMSEAIGRTGRAAEGAHKAGRAHTRARLEVTRLVRVEASGTIGHAVLAEGAHVAGVLTPPPNVAEVAHTFGAITCARHVVGARAPLDTSVAVHTAGTFVDLVLTPRAKVARPTQTLARAMVARLRGGTLTVAAVLAPEAVSVGGTLQTTVVPTEAGQTRAGACGHFR